jgi:glutamine synthetase
MSTQPLIASEGEGLAAAFADAESLWIVYHDFPGIGRAKSVPSARFNDVLAEGVTFARANWDFTVTNVQIPAPAYAADSGDFRAIPDRATCRRLPHMPGVVQCFADLYLGEQPWDGDPRGRLKLVIDELGTFGYAAHMAFESEFLVLRGTSDDGWLPVEREPMFTLSALESQWATWGRSTLGHLEAVGIPVHQFAREFGEGQFELSLLPSDPVTACDRFLLARQIIKANMPSGTVATFMPKPFADRPGNGLHVHLSLIDQNGAAVLAHETDPDALSPTGMSVVAALLAHARGQSALGSATPNSYRRLVPGSWAPAHVAWAFMNRSALVRIPGTGSARRIEYRSGDASANVYLHALGLIAAVIEGLRREVPPVPPLQIDIGRLQDADAAAKGALRLPQSLSEALDALEADQVLTEALGSSIWQHYAAVKRAEQAIYEQQSGSEQDDVSAWERRAYLQAL